MINSVFLFTQGEETAEDSGHTSVYYGGRNWLYSE